MKAIITTLVLVLTVQANATVWLKSEPSNKLTAKQALEAAKSEKAIYKCRKTMMSENLRPKSVKGSKDSFHATVGESDETATTAMLNGEKVFKCSEVEFSSESGSFKKVN